MRKQPISEVDRVACLAFYLRHYRHTPDFKTRDISKLNAEAAQLKFSNAGVAVANATQKGLLVPSRKRHKQLSVVGEQYALALPDREAAWAARMALRRRRRTRKNAQNSAAEIIESTDGH